MRRTPCHPAALDGPDPFQPRKKLACRHAFPLGVLELCAFASVTTSTFQNSPHSRQRAIARQMARSMLSGVHLMTRDGLALVRIEDIKTPSPVRARLLSGES